MKKLILIFGLLAGSAAAQVYTTGEKFHTVCSDTAPISQVACSNYILGVSDAFFTSANLATSLSGESALNGLICLPENVHHQQLIDVVRKYVSDNPKYRHLTAADLIFSAMIGAFPCPE